MKSLLRGYYLSFTEGKMEIQQFCKLPDNGQSRMRAAMSQLDLSARAYDRILKSTPTLADLAGYAEIASMCLAEGLSLEGS